MRHHLNVSDEFTAILRNPLPIRDKTLAIQTNRVLRHPFRLIKGISLRQTPWQCRYADIVSTFLRRLKNHGEIVNER